MQINISIQLEPGELAETLTRLAMLFAPKALTPELPPTPPTALPSPDTPASDGTPVLPAIPPATEAADAESVPPVTPSARKTKSSAEKRPAVLDGETPAPKRAITSARLPIDDLDPLVRSEMKRLSMDGRMPNHSLWNNERDVRLPTLGGVMARYGVGTLVDLAAKLDMQPPLSAVATNGVYHKEPAP